MNADPSIPRPNGLPPGGTASLNRDPNPASCGKAPAHILVVDDDPDVLRVLGSALEMFDYQVHTAADGAVAWEELCAHSYDLIVTDHMMPKLTGLDLLRRLRTVRPDLPCILLSGHLPGSEADLSSLLRPGRAVEKPVKLETLVTMVRALLAAHPIRHASVHSENSHPALCPT